MTLGFIFGGLFSLSLFASSLISSILRSFSSGSFSGGFIGLELGSCLFLLLHASGFGFGGLLSSLSSNHLAQVLFFFFLFLNDLQVVSLLLLIASSNGIGFFIIFLVNLGVVLVLASTALVVLEAALVVDGVFHVGHQVAVLAVKRVLEFNV